MISLGGDRVAIVPIYDADMSTGQFADPSLPTVKLYIPDEAKKRTAQGLVKYVGPKCKYTHPGQYVIYSQFSGTLTEIEGEGKLIIMQEEFIYAELHDRNIEIPGLYFRTRSYPDDTLKALKKALMEIADFTNDQLQVLASHLEMVGFEQTREIYIPATYEQVVQLASEEFTRKNRTLNITTSKLRDEEWDSTTLHKG